MYGQPCCRSVRWRLGAEQTLVSFPDRNWLADGVEAGTSDGVGAREELNTC